MPNSLQINNLSTNFLALLLLPRMLTTANEHNTTPRIVLVASEVHYWAKLAQEMVDSKAPWQASNEPKRYKAAYVYRTHISVIRYSFVCILWSVISRNGTARYFDTKRKSSSISTFCLQFHPHPPP
jgi:hypothetical protein